MDFRSALLPYTKQYLLSECELLSKSSTKESIKKCVDDLYFHLKTKPYEEHDLYLHLSEDVIDPEYETLSPTLYIFQSPRELVSECADLSLVINIAEHRVLHQVDTLFHLSKPYEKDQDDILYLRKDPEHKRWVSYPSQLTSDLLENLWNNLDAPEQISNLQVARHKSFLLRWFGYEDHNLNSQFELLEGLAKIGSFTWFSKDSVWVSENPVVVKVGFKKIDLIFKDGWEFSYDLPEKFQDIVECEFLDK
jgi:hypothetical protein